VIFGIDERELSDSAPMMTSTRLRLNDLALTPLLLISSL